jgi:hypothetical protein
VENFWVNAAWSVTPTILIGLVFWLVLRTILRADRTERKVYAQIEAEERAKLGRPDPAREMPLAASPRRRK